LMRGLLIACAKRPIAPEQLGALIDSIEAELRNASKSEIGSKELGDMALVRLAKLDDVAYVRFASVYKDFQNVEEFAAALEGLK
ncbi:MAG: transcriptional regulator NrdR, partial [Limosilactobacillus mucosae]|nr:transcriptional regulator NrdR [Limosilactobacillus mucosae]